MGCTPRTYWEILPGNTYRTSVSNLQFKFHLMCWNMRSNPMHVHLDLSSTEFKRTTLSMCTEDCNIWHISVQWNVYGCNSYGVKGNKPVIWLCTNKSFVWNLILSILPHSHILHGFFCSHCVYSYIQIIFQGNNTTGTAKGLADGFRKAKVS